MTDPDPALDDWAPFIATITEHQKQSERDGAFLRARAEVEQRFTDLETFHRALSSDEITAEELAALGESLSTGSVGGTTAAEMEQLRRDLARSPIRFTPAEPPSCAIHLSRSFTRVSELMGLDQSHEFLFATDYRYRPHASVQQWAENRYLVLMGRYVVEDIWTLSLMLAQLIVLAGRAFPDLEEPWTHPDFPQALLDTAEENPYFHQQIAYGMCATVEGERYRTAVGVAGLAPEQRVMLNPVMFEIACGALDFLVGHELSHVYRSHLHAADRPVGESPWFVSEAFDRVRESSNGAAETYLRDYWPAHSLELEADMFAMMSAADIGAAVAQDLRLVGIQFAVSVLSFLDRANYVIEFGYDPAEAIGLREYNRVPGFVDVMLPMATHPWGKTRATWVPTTVQLVYRSLVEPAELRRKALLMQAVANLLASMSGPALNAIRWINGRPGECLAVLLPGDKLITHYWPPDATVEDDRLERIESIASRFYTDIAGPALSATVLPARHAAEMMRRVAGPGLLEGAEELCRVLGYLAPAVEQAAAYMNQSGLSAAAYLRQLPDPGRDDPQQAMTLTCQVSLDRIRAACGILPEAMFRIMAWYAPDDIPLEVLYSRGDVFPADEVDAALATLEAYALVARGGDAVSVHPLVQVVARDAGADEPEPVFPANETREVALRLLEASIPGWEDPADWPAWRRLLPHIDVMAGHLATHSGHEPPVALWSATAQYLLDQGMPDRAIAYFTRALSDQQGLQGPDHPDTLALRHSLGHARIVAGDYPEAISLLERTVTDQEHVIGPRHPDTLTTRNSLAAACRAAGDLSRAIRLLERTVSDRRRVLGRRHPHTLASQNDLAVAYSAAGEPSRAIRLFRKVVARSQRVKGSDHPDVVITRGNLAHAYFAAERISKAIPLLEQSVADHERVFGPDHPNTGIAKNNLASAYVAGGAPSRAIPILETLVAELESVSGPDHPHTLTSKHNLVSAYVAAQDYARAIPLAEQNLAAFERTLGSDHPSTLMSRTMLATAAEGAGELDGDP
ncbi:tetratricopeptide repeat protein [Nonomuraea dietziae]|uniref:tetratricopeptide repeat protein n=1 Tax=Nonomuraea dietziae TaxID=65515 RepID=UPI0033FB7E6A